MIKSNKALVSRSDRTDGTSKIKTSLRLRSGIRSGEQLTLFEAVYTYDPGGGPREFSGWANHV